MQKLAHEIYSFDSFQLDLTRGALFRGEKELKLRPKSFDVLKYFAENNGRLISKDEIIAAVWHETAVTDDSLVQCLKDIRHALDDDKQQIIRTVPRRGYIFEKEVSENGSSVYLEETSGVHVVIEEVEEDNRPDVIETFQTQSGSFAAVDSVRIGRRTIGINTTATAVEYTDPSLRSRFKTHRLAAIFTLAALILVAGGIAFWIFSNKKNVENAPPMAASLFRNVEAKGISHVGNIGNTAISPDGKYVVYSTIENGNEGLWLRQIATDSTQQVIAAAKLHYFGVSFSRDGEYIYYLRSDGASADPRALYRIPTLGGVAEKVMTNMDWCPSFSPDGSQMTFVRNANESLLMIAAATGRDERIIAKRPLNEAFSFPAWSPDGQKIAASAGSVELGDSFRDVVEVSIADGVDRNLTARKWYWIDKGAWLADGSGLVISGNPTKSHVHNQVWLLGYSNGEARPITNDSYNYTNISLTADSSTLIAGHTELLSHLWIAPEGDAVRASRISAGLGAYKHIRWTPDGKLVVSALGNKNIDISLRGADGAEIKQLTVNAGTNWGQEVSRDGRYIVFDSDRTGDFHIWRMDLDGGNPVQLTNGNGEKFADISPDGKWIVYTYFSDWTLWKVSIEGGSPVQVVKSYARQSSISPDGKWIVYMASENNRQIVIPFEGNTPAKTINLPPDAPLLQPVRWSPDSQAIQFIVRRDGVENIWQQPLNGGTPKQITNFTSDSIFSYDWSDDGTQLALVRGAWTADMVLMSQR